MSVKEIDAGLLKQAFLAGAKQLEEKKEWINELNVFPVPDGDTGTNMTMTIMAAAREVAEMEEPTIETIAKAISSGSLRGARGNSGVILSQLFRGLTKELKACERIDVPVLANAFVRASDTAYKAVMKPKEGTILTVAREMAQKAQELSDQTDDILEFSRKVIEHGDYVLSQTPEMLPVLKQAGVVDSGGQGLMQVMKGAYDGLSGKQVDLDSLTGGFTGLTGTSSGSGTQSGTAAATAAGEGGRRTVDRANLETSDIRFGYCTEFIINLEQHYDEVEEGRFKAYLESIGDSLVVVSDDDIVKVHVHTNDPGLAIQKALTYGSLSRMKIDNMREEHRELLIQDAGQKASRTQTSQKVEQPREKKAYGFIAVSVGEGLDEIFQGIGADYVIAGGQTMNPSTEDILKAVEQVYAETVYIFPNNKNIILAAEQVKYLAEGKHIVVVPSRTVPQGITALINFVPELSAEENLENMTAEMERVRTGQITYAVRDTEIDGYTIHEGDIMGIGDQGIAAVGQSIEGTTLDTLKALVDEESELVTIYYGSDVSESEAEMVFEQAKEAFPKLEVELHMGGQPVYYYLISVE